MIPDGRHVVVARGRDYPDVTPLKGIYSGSASSRMFVEVQIRRLNYKRDSLEDIFLKAMEAPNGRL